MRRRDAPIGGQLVTRRHGCLYRMIVWFILFFAWQPKVVLKQASCVSKAVFGQYHCLCLASRILDPPFLEYVACELV
jgi:hypothetical protein